MSARAESRRAKQLESIVGKHALKFLPFAGGRTSEAVFNTLIISIIAQEGPCWPYRVIQLFLSQWRKEESRLKALGFKKEPTHLGIQKRIEDLEHAGFLRSLTPSELDKIPNLSDRASKVYDLSRRGFALCWLLNPIRNHDEALLKVLKRKEEEGGTVQGGRLLGKLIESKKVGYLMRRIILVATIRLLSELEEDEVEYGIPASDLGQEEEIWVWTRYGELLLFAMADILSKIQTLPQSKRVKYIQGIGPPERILEEREEVIRLAKEDPDFRQSLSMAKQATLDAAQKLGI